MKNYKYVFVYRIVYRIELCKEIRKYLLHLFDYKKKRHKKVILKSYMKICNFSENEFKKLTL